MQVEQLIPDEQLAQSMKAFGRLSDRLTPWFIDVGSWVFGGFIALDLFMVAALVTIGPVDRAIIISAAAFALTLPLHVAGLFLLRLIKDLKTIGVEAETVRAFQEAGFTVGTQLPSLEEIEARQKRRTGGALWFCFTILTLSVLLTLVGLFAALWHVAWWVAVAFLATAVISQGPVMIVISAFQPPRSPELQKQLKRYGDKVAAQAKAQALAEAAAEAEAEAIAEVEARHPHNEEREPAL